MKVGVGSLQICRNQIEESGTTRNEGDVHNSGVIEWQQHNTSWLKKDIRKVPKKVPNFQLQVTGFTPIPTFRPWFLTWGLAPSTPLTYLLIFGKKKKTRHC